MCNIQEDMPDFLEVKVKNEINLDNTFLPVADSTDYLVGDYSTFKLKKEYEHIDNDELNTNSLKQVDNTYVNFKCKEEITDEGQSEISKKFVKENQQSDEEFSESCKADEKIDISRIILQPTHYNENEFKFETDNDIENQKTFTQRNSPDDDLQNQGNNSIQNKAEMKTCQFCNKSFRSKISLDDHLLKEHNNNIANDINMIHKCKFCSFATTRTHLLNMHISSHNKQELNKNCKFCNKSYNAKRTLDDHLLKQHKQEIKADLKSLITSKIFTCNICNSYETTNKNDIARHVNLVHNEVKIKMKCQFCTKTFISKQSLDGHVVRTHKDNIKNNIKSFITSKIHVCKICNSYETTLKSNLDSHIYKAHNEVKKKMQCQFCAESFTLQTSLDGHLIKKHKAKIKGDIKAFVTSKIHSCKMCSFESPIKGILDNHINSIHNKKLKFKCEFCDELFPLKYTLDNHLLNQHKGEIKGKIKKFVSSQIYKCKICGSYQTRSRCQLKKHLSECHIV